uniref:Small integral membrane protein 14 n=1 Tax=Aedes albopictus TaxID=7160 RepID=A0A023EEI2_AEDAL
MECECIWSHETGPCVDYCRFSAIGQSYCTDNECIDLPNAPNQGASDNFFMLMLFMIFAVILYAMRPASLRRRNDLNKALPPSNGGPSNDGRPPAVN